jgi:hypothetical protein
MTARRPPMPEPPPRRRRRSTRGERFRMWRVRGPVGKVTVSYVSDCRAVPDDRDDGDGHLTTGRGV